MENNLSKKVYQIIENIGHDFNIKECLKIKEYEKKINHDVKAIEYYLRDKFEKYNINQYIHLGLTSQDINNTAIIFMLKEFINKNYLCTIMILLDNLKNKSNNKIWKETKMIGLTHGQPATLTSMGDYFKVFHYRLETEIKKLIKYKFYTKFGGAVGNLEAHKICYPEINWDKWTKNFIETDLHLYLQEYTTQIMNYESLVELFNIVMRINSILIDFAVDIWLYISKEYFHYDNQGNVGSSTMPHKINPILFENAEGNLIMANGIFETLGRKLPISRWQRDLTDSTLVRNIGVPFCHSLLSYQNLIDGISRLKLNVDKINQDVKDNVVVSGEILQTILRKYGFVNGYEIIKQLTQSNNKITLEELDNTIQKFDWDDTIKKEMFQYLKLF